MGKRQGNGCFLPLLILFIVVILRFGSDEKSTQTPDDNPRRPLVEEQSVDPVRGGEYEIADPGKARDSQGTAFAVGSTGMWLTAEHVVHGCERLGLAQSDRQAQTVMDITESRVSDAALITDGLPSIVVVPLTDILPKPGSNGYHMGFPSGEAAVVHSQYIGLGNAVRGPGRSQPVMVWAEMDRTPEFEHSLGGISGGPTYDETGHVVGINSAASERRGRVLTTHPKQALNLMHAAQVQLRTIRATPITDTASAVQHFSTLLRAGAIRPVYCDVTD